MKVRLDPIMVATSVHRRLADMRGGALFRGWTNVGVTSRMADSRASWRRVRARHRSSPKRREDILPLARQFLGGAAKRFGKKAPALAPKAANLLLRYTWPGNVRESENALERAVVLARADRIGADDLPPEVGAAPSAIQPASEIRTLAELERDYIAAALRASGGNRAKAAPRLGIGAATLYRQPKQEPR